MSEDIISPAIVSKLYSQLIKGINTKPYAALLTLIDDFTVEQKQAILKKLINRLLNRYRWPVNNEDVDGQTLLMWASQNGYEEIINILLNRHADVDIVNVFGETALFKAVFYNHLAVVKILLDNGADLEKVIMRGTTALDFAVFKHCHTKYDELEMIKIFLEHRLQQKMAALQEIANHQFLAKQALGSGKYSLYNLLVKDFQQSHPHTHYLQYYVSLDVPDDNPSAITFLLQQEPDFLTRHPDCLYLVIKNNCGKMAQRILELSSPATRQHLFKYKGEEDKTALFEALSMNSIFNASLLLSFGNDLADLDANGEALLKKALSQPEWAEMLAEYAQVVEHTKTKISQQTLVERAAQKIYQYNRENKVSIINTELPYELLDFIQNEAPMMIEMHARFCISQKAESLLEKCIPKNHEQKQPINTLGMVCKYERKLY